MVASETTNYGLVKPAGNDYYDIGVANGNMDKVDTALKANADAAATARGKTKAFTLPAAGWTASGGAYTQAATMAGLTDDYILSWSWASSADGEACVAAEIMLDASCDSAGLATLTWTAKALPAGAIRVFVVAELPVAVE